LNRAVGTRKPPIRAKQNISSLIIFTPIPLLIM
jgi:hypothetical protein